MLNCFLINLNLGLSFPDYKIPFLSYISFAEAQQKKQAKDQSKNSKPATAAKISQATPVPITASVQTVSIEELYSSALQKKEFSDTQKSRIQQSYYQKKQAESVVFPNVSANAQYIETTLNPEVGADEETTLKTVGLSLKQPLFKYGLFAGVKREKYNYQAVELQNKTNELDLFSRIAQSYYRIQSLESTRSILQELNELSQKRVSIFSSRVKIGKSKKQDFLTNQIQFQGLQAQLKDIEAQLIEEKLKLSEMTGMSKDISVSAPFQAVQPKPLSFYTDKSLETPEIQIQEKLSLSAVENIGVTKTNYFPYIYADLSAKYGEFSSGIKGDEYSIGVKLELPLFVGGGDYAQVQQAQWKSIEEKTKLSSLKMSTRLEIENLYIQLEKNIELYKLYGESLGVARENYKLFNREFDLGLVSNLDLLNSLNSYLDNKKNLDEAYYNMKVSELELNRKVGAR